jgi:hypothetical protein
MPPRMAPSKRDAILEDIRAGKPRNQIARDHGVSAGSVTNIARENKLDDAFDRSGTVKAARAKQADNKAKRTQLQSDLLDDAQKLRKRAWSRYPVVVNSMEGAEKVWLDLPPLPDVRAAYTSIGIIVDKDAAIERASSDGGADAAKSMLGQLFDGLVQVVEAGRETPQDDG